MSGTRFRHLQRAIGLACAACFAIPAYFSFHARAASSAARANVQTAITAAEAYSRGTGFYSGISGRRLRRQTPGLDRNLRAVAVNGDAAYCLDDRVNGEVYDYVGGVPGGALRDGHQPAVVEPGPCAAAVGAPAVQ
ncbi:MAG TPA: hypothetical protein VFA88_10530 [Gaiellaceae bacterium]|nr:hypothetical protein [Gaiellaceae bacterium]